MKVPRPRSRGPSGSQCSSSAWGRPCSNNTRVRWAGNPNQASGSGKGKLHCLGVTHTWAAGKALAIAGTGSLCSRPELVGSTIVQTGP